MFVSTEWYYRQDKTRQDEEGLKRNRKIDFFWIFHLFFKQNFSFFISYSLAFIMLVFNIWFFMLFMLFLSRLFLLPTNNDDDEEFYKKKTQLILCINGNINYVHSWIIISLSLSILSFSHSHNFLNIFFLYLNASLWMSMRYENKMSYNFHFRCIAQYFLSRNLQNDY